MQKRKLGNTGLELSIMGMGGFHFIETAKNEVEFLLNTYLDHGGNYIETAADYGHGISERKIGMTVARRRQDYFLASKCVKRNRNDAEKSIETSLRNLNTDYLDILFLHAVQTAEDVNAIFSANGAMEAVIAAQKAGKIRYIGISGHGYPLALQQALQQTDFDVLLTGFNYIDRFNFPSIETELLPECQRRGIGVMAMKALADGYLYFSTELAIRYTLSLPITTLVLGANTRHYLELDLKIIENFRPLSTDEQTRLFYSAIELGYYVCRQCKKCDVIDPFKPSEIFLLEGIFDRQMSDGTVDDPEKYALQERLKHWFAQTEIAQNMYQALSQRVDPHRDYSDLNQLCPYGIDVDRKLKLVHAKLGDDGYVF